MKNPPPIDQPTAYTCQNCGAGLTERVEFCPRCGARLSNQRSAQLTIWQIISLSIAALGVLFFGAIGACSGFLVLNSFGPQTGELTPRELLIFSIPLFIIGLAGFVWCLRVLLKRSKN